MLFSRSPSAANAKPKPVWVTADSSGTRSRVHSFKASVRCRYGVFASRAVLFSRSPSASNAKPKPVWVAARFERHPLARTLFQGFLVCSYGVLEQSGVILPLPERPQCKGQVVLDCCPIKRHPLVCRLFQGFLSAATASWSTAGVDTLLLPERRQRKAQTGFGRRPIERRPACAYALSRLPRCAGTAFAAEQCYSLAPRAPPMQSLSRFGSSPNRAVCVRE